MKMHSGIMFCNGRLLILWIMFLNVAHARHIQLATQRIRAQSRPRLLIIRPPEGSGQPNRIVVLANSRPKPTNPSPPLSTAISSLQDTSAAAKTGLDRAFGGHPQSAISQQSKISSSSASSSSSSSASSSSKSESKTSSASSSTGGRSLREMLQTRNRAAHSHGTVGNGNRPNIVRSADGIPRAAPPVLPVAQKFGALNIPRGIEAELRRLQEQAKRASSVRQPNIRPHHRHHVHGMPSSAPPPSPFHGGIIDLSKVSLHDRGQALDVPAGDSGRPSGSNPRWDIGTLRSLGRNGILSRPGSWNKEQFPATRREPAFVKNNELLQMPTGIRRGTLGKGRKTGSNMRTFQDKAVDINPGLNKVSKAPTLDLQTLLMSPENPKGSFDLSNTVGQGPASASSSLASGPSQQLTKQPDKTATGNIPSPSSIGGAGKQNIPPPPQPKSPAPGLSMNLNATAKVSSSSANSTTNTTSKKSVKTKTIKVTTVVKGGTKADVTAAAASQAEIANAVAQGKEINSSALAGLTTAASGMAKGTKASKTGPPVGSITVKRQPNGESIITLSDGQGEPVVLRATGPVKIERIVKPNGRVQFLINPLNPPKPPPTTPFVDPGEIEAEEITTTVSSVSTTGTNTFSATEAVWSTSTPFYAEATNTEPNLVVSSFEPSASVSSSSKSGSKSSQVKTTVVQMNSTETKNSSSQQSSSVTKNKTIQAKTETKGILQLFPSQKIPPPPKLSGTNFGSKNQSNPFFLDTNKLSQNSGLPLNHAGQSRTGASTKTQSQDRRPIQLYTEGGSGASVRSARGRSDVMPHYKLLGVSPPAHFASRSNRAP